MCIQFQKIPRIASDFVSYNNLQIGQHVVLLHTQITVKKNELNTDLSAMK